jgi:cytochrome c2
MLLAGVTSAQDRADIIDYLRTLSDHPEPLPTP